MEDIRKDAKPQESEDKPTIEDQAAHDFRKLLPLFWDKIEPMSRRQQQRVFQALISYPLEDAFPKFSYQVEKDAFYLGLQLNDCKFILMTAVANMLKSKEALDKFQEEIKELRKQQAEEELKVDLQSGL